MPPPDPWRPAWLRQHPQHWTTGTLDREALLASAQALAARPGFLAVAQRFARCWLATQYAHPALRAVFRNSQRYLMLVASLVLHHQRDHADPGSGLTPLRMRSFFAQVQGSPFAAGDTQIKAMVAHARLHRLLEDAPVAGDGRYRPLVPTALLHQVFEQWVGGFLDAMHGEAGLELPAPWPEIVSVPGLVPEVFCYRMAALREDQFVLTEPVADGLRWVLQHDHGYRVFLHCVGALQGEPDGSALIQTSASALATQAGVTRGTVRNLLKAAEQKGWFAAAATGAAGRRWSADQVGTALLWIALELTWMHGLVCAAWSGRKHYSA